MTETPEENTDRPQTDPPSIELVEEDEYDLVLPLQNERAYW